MTHVSAWLQRQGITDLDNSDPWISSMSLKSFAANDFLVHAGDISDTLYLLRQGLVRLFYTTPDGRERNKGFYRAGQVTGPVSAAMTSSAAPFSIQCIEPLEAIAFSYAAFAEAALRHKGVAQLSRDLLSEAFIRNEQREAMLLTCNAEQRYHWLLQHEADLLQRVAQFHIASYLGIDAVSLSRLKRKHKD